MRQLYTTIAIIYLLFAGNFLQLYAGNPVKVVVIDAGHGGNDPGAIGISGVNEKDITLALALKLGALIEKNTDVKVIYTRKSDVAVDLYKRSQIANNHHADYFISIHCNSVDKNATAKGAETFVMGLTKTESSLAIAQKENAVILNEQNHENNYDKVDITSPEAYILISIWQNAYRNQSINLAAAVQSELTNFCKRQDRGVKEAGFQVLWRSTMPSILVETGFLSNKEEETYLASEKGQAELALALYNGFAKTAHLEALKKPDLSHLADTIPSDAKTTTSIVYRVQFLTSPNKIEKTAPELKNLSEIEIEKVGNAYKYTTGNCATHAEARDLLTNVKKTGFADAFIVTVKNVKIDTENIDKNDKVDKVDKIDTVAKVDVISVNNTVTEANVVYKIQFLNTTKEYKKTDPILKNLPDIEILKVGNINKYTTGKCSTYEDAKKLLDRAKEVGFSDAFMLAYKKDGTKISIQEAKELENKK